MQQPVGRGPERTGPFSHAEACRRLFVDMVGRVPSADEAEATCSGSWGDTVKRLMDTPEFIFVNQRRAADSSSTATRW